MATASKDVASQIAYLTRALKAPSLGTAVGRLAERARAENWTHEEFLTFRRGQPRPIWPYATVLGLR